MRDRNVYRETTRQYEKCGLGIVIATAGTISARLYSADSSTMDKITKQVQALSDLQRHINDKLADIHPAAAVQEAGVASVASARRSSPPLAPPNAIPPRVLPAAAPPQCAPADIDGLAAFDASSPSYDTHPPAPSPATHAPYIVYSRTEAPYRPRAWHYRAAVRVPRPVAHFIATVRGRVIWGPAYSSDAAGG